MRTKVIRAMPPATEKASQGFPWTLGVGAAGLILVGAVWPFIGSSGTEGSPTAAPVTAQSQVASAPVLVEHTTVESEALAQPVTAPVQTEQDSAEATAPVASEPTVVEAAPVPASAPAEPTGPVVAEKPAELPQPKGGAAASLESRKNSAAQPSKAVDRPVRAVPAKKDAAAPHPRPELAPTSAVAKAAPPPPPSVRGSPITTKQTEYAAERERPAPARQEKEQPSPREATKPAVPDVVEVQNPRVLTVVGDLAYVRINPRQTVVVKVGAQLPGLGTLKSVDGAGATFDKQFVPNMN